MEKLKTLVIEDDRSTQGVYNYALPEQIFDKRITDTGESGLEIYQSWHPDIIILDIGLPDMDGVLVLNKIRKEFNNTSTAIIIVTSMSDRERVMECMKIGINGFIVKPIHSQLISEQILQYYNKSKKKKGMDPHIGTDIIVEMTTHQWSNLENIEVNAMKMELSVGIEIVLEIEGIEIKLHSFITGIHHGQYIMIECPKMTGIDTKLYGGNIVKVIYLHSGKIYVFQAKILNFIKIPSRLIFLSYPESVEIRQLRKEQRVNCFLVASVRGVNQTAEYSGMVIDISIKGCKFVTTNPLRSLQPLQSGNKMELLLEFPGSKDAVFFPGELRSITQEGSRTSIGIEFMEPGSESVQIAANYIKTGIDFI